MASKKAIGMQNARRSIRRLENARSKLDLETIDALYRMAGRARNIPAHAVTNHIADYYLAMQGDQRVDPPGYVRALVNVTLKESKEKPRQRGRPVTSGFVEDPASAYA